MRVDLGLYVGGFKEASGRFAASALDFPRGFTATFEAVMWAASIRDHLRAIDSDHLTACPHARGSSTSGASCSPTCIRC